MEFPEKWHKLRKYWKTTKTAKGTDRIRLPDEVLKA